jgi:hypothetical protein
MKLVSQSGLLRRLIILACFVAAVCYGQGDRGLLTGFVKDTSGAVIVGATVRATNTATGVVVSTQSNDDGNYSLNYVPVGEYTITANKTGFKQFERENVEVLINNRLTLDITLEVGSTSETITISSGAPLLETTNSSMGTVVDNKRVTQLPLFYGNPMMLQYTTPGTIQGNTGTMTYVRPYDTTGTSTASINGARERSTDFQIDGVTDNNLTNDPAFQPSTEFVQEYKVETASYDAGQGHGLAFVNTTLKSGTNEFHGSAYWYLRNLDLNANDFFSNAAGKPRCCDTTFRRWEASGGGPIIKNKLFFFGGIERIQENGTGSATLTVPTQAERNGDLSSLLALGPSYQLYDPATTYSLGNGHMGRSPIPGNIIPASRIDPIAKNILNYFPMPNQPGTATGLNNYYWNTGLSISSYYSEIVRVDYNIGEKDRLFGRITHGTRVNGPSSNYFPGASGSYWNFNGEGMALDYTHTFNSSTVLDVRYGATYQPSWSALATAGFDLSKLGFPASVASQIGEPMKAFPQIQFNWGSGALSTLDNSGAYGNKGLFHTVSATVSRLHGKHNLRFGTDMRALLIGVYNYYNNEGVFTFNGGWLNGPTDTAAAAPVAGPIGTLLLGIPDSSRLDWSASAAGLNRYFGAFVQDDWKVTSRLTINLGLRYEYEGAPTERYNRTVTGFAFNTPSPVNAAAQAAYALNPIPEIPVNQFSAMGGVTFAGVSGNPRSAYNAPKIDFMPRVGFAYALDSKTVVRGGYGIFFDELGLTMQSFNQPGFSESTVTYPSVDNGLTFPGTLSNPFFQGYLQPVGASAGLATSLGSTISFFNQNPKSPYNQRWSLGVQRTLKGNIVVEADYVGSRGTDLLISRNLDGTPDQFLSQTRERNQAVIARLGQQVPNPFAGLLPGSLGNATISVGNLVRPYPQFSSVTEMTNDGFSWYHALQTSLQKRMSHGLTMMTSWTWSKNMNATTWLNPMDPRPYGQISSDDRTHRFTASAVYELPIGKGKALLGSPSRVLGVFVNSWQISPMYTFQSGPPLGFSGAGADFLFTGDPSKIVLPYFDRSINQWFNTSGFVTNPSVQLTSELRAQPTLFSGLRAMGMNDMDISLVKKFHIAERFSAELRGEAVNAFNHPMFSAPNTDPTSTLFGKVTGTYYWPRNIQIGFLMRF